MRQQLHAIFFPFMAHGHMIPTLDMAKLFASRGIETGLITTPQNAPAMRKAMELSGEHSSVKITFHTIKFPAVEAGLPEGVENLAQLSSTEMHSTFFRATTMLQDQVEKILLEYRPSCLVPDMFFPWATDVASKFDIPVIFFSITCFFSICAKEQIRIHKPFKTITSDTEPFVVPNLPHNIKLFKSQLVEHKVDQIESEFSKTLAQGQESESRSFGVIFNTFYELEPDYADHYRTVLNRKAWHIGPVSLCNFGVDLDKAQKTKKESTSEHESLKWLDLNKPDSVIFISFGSLANFSSQQLYEIASGLEASGQQFIWVVKKEENDCNWMPEGFEERMKGKGLILRGWSPQMLILEHEAVGSFMTHCGWNSVLEAVSAGLSMVTWPLFAEQFYVEKLLTEVSRIGVAVGAKEWNTTKSELIKRDAVEMAVKCIMVGEEAEEIRSRAKALQVMARKAVEDDGSSISDLNSLIKELSSYHT